MGGITALPWHEAGETGMKNMLLILHEHPENTTTYSANQRQNSCI
jgi:hypothetical protein